MSAITLRCQFYATLKPSIKRHNETINLTLSGFDQYYVTMSLMSLVIKDFSY